MNISFEYCYRDGANYKKYNTEIFSNINNISIQEVETKIQLALIDGEWFYADKWGLPDLHFEDWDNEIDHEWHEFQKIVETVDLSTITEDISTFFLRINA